MSEKIDYSKGIYDARQLGAGRMFILGVQHKPGLHLLPSDG